MAPYYFWADTDSDWECAAGDNWRDVSGGGGTLYTGGSKQPSAADTIFIEKDCTTNADHSATVFADLQVDAGKTLTVASGGDIRFDTAATNIDGKITLPTGGNIRFTNILTDVVSGGEIELDGGTLEIYNTAGGNSGLKINVGATMTGTANVGNVGGDVVVNTTTTLKPRNELKGDIIGTAGARIVLNGAAGTQKTWWGIFGNVSVENVDFDQWSRLQFVVGIGLHMDVSNCLFHGANGDLPGDFWFESNSPLVTFRSCYIYFTAGLSTLRDMVSARFFDCVFGETEGAAPAANTQDLISYWAHLNFHNCLFSSPTFLGSDTTGGELISTSHDQDERDWRHYQNVGHYALPEFGAGAQGGSGAAVKCLTSSLAADTNGERFRRLVAVIPATHGDLIDVTLYIKGTASNTAVLRIDPDSIYGTTQAYNETADGAWNQRTIPQYTVNVSGGAGTKVAIPIYLDMTGASETWYYDTLDWTIS